MQVIVMATRVEWTEKAASQSQARWRLLAVAARQAAGARERDRPIYGAVGRNNG